LAKLLTVLAVAATLCNHPVHAQQGLTDTEIRIGMWTPLSGPLSLLGTSTRDAVRLWADEVNGRGGIHGRKIKFIAYDDAGSPQEAQAAVRRLLSQDDVFALIGGSVSGSTLPVRQVIDRAKVPFIASVSSNINLMKPFSRYIFRIYANENALSDVLVSWTIKDLKSKKPAIIYTSNDYGVGGYRAIGEYLKNEHGINIVAAERYNPTDQDFSAQLLRVRSSGADALIIYSFAAEAGIIVRQAKELGLDLPIVGGAATATPLFQRAAGDAARGFYAVYPIPELTETSKSPAVLRYRKMLDQLHPTGMPAGRPSEYDFLSYSAAKTLELALEKSGRNLDRETLVKQLEAIKSLDTGLIFPISFSADNHEATSHASIIRVGDDLHWRVVKGHDD
jgi:branched-chain amino acid transport system substrate-binding protein